MLNTGWYILDENREGQLEIIKRKSAWALRYFVFIGALIAATLGLTFGYLLLSADDNARLYLAVMIVFLAVCTLYFCYKAIEVLLGGEKVVVDLKKGYIMVNGKNPINLAGKVSVILECSGGYPRTFALLINEQQVARVLTDFNQAAAIARTVANYLHTVVIERFC